ncbi:MAG: zinc ribbon domain-containing protein [Clostridia bacterium]|nr:zinc ribbon domain-containing protein [Clostridia bacterium]
MFCPECGNQLEDGSMQCSYCGHVLMTNDNEEPNDVKYDDNSYVDETHIDGFTQDVTVTDEQEENDAEDAESQESYELSGEFENIDNNKSKVDNKLVKRIVIFVVVVAVIACIPVICNKIYESTDSYKIKEASELIYNGNCSSGIEKISDIYTPQAIAIKNFAEVENSRRSFFDFYYKNFEDFTGSCKAYALFEKKLDEFDESTDYNYLPENLLQRYKNYRTAFDFISDSTAEVYADLHDIQLVMLNEVARNNSSKGGSTFKLSELQANIDKSKAASERLEEFFNVSPVDHHKDIEWAEPLFMVFADATVDVNDYNVEAYCEVSQATTNSGESYSYISVGYDLINELICNCRDEMVTSQKMIDKSLKEFDLDDDLYMVSPEENYSSFISNDLNNIKDKNDIMENRDKIVGYLEITMLGSLVY